jgi:hypothetical protein
MCIQMITEKKENASYRQKKRQREEEEKEIKREIDRAFKKKRKDIQQGRVKAPADHSDDDAPPIRVRLHTSRSSSRSSSCSTDGSLGFSNLQVSSKAPAPA